MNPIKIKNDQTLPNIGLNTAPSTQTISLPRPISTPNISLPAPADPGQHTSLGLDDHAANFNDQALQLKQSLAQGQIDKPTFIKQFSQIPGESTKAGILQKYSPRNVGGAAAGAVKQTAIGIGQGFERSAARVGISGASLVEKATGVPQSPYLVPGNMPGGKNLFGAAPIQSYQQEQSQHGGLAGGIAVAGSIASDYPGSPGKANMINDLVKAEKAEDVVNILVKGGVDANVAKGVAAKIANSTDKQEIVDAVNQAKDPMAVIKANAPPPYTGPNRNEGAFSKEDVTNLEKQNTDAQVKLMASEKEKLAAMPTDEELSKGVRTPEGMRSPPELIGKSNYDLEYKVPQGSPEGAIAAAGARTSEEGARFAKTDVLQNKLDAHDRNLLYRYDQGEDIESIAKDAHNPKQFTKAANSAIDALDYAAGHERAITGEGNIQKHYLPKYLQADKGTLDALGVPEEDRFELNGDKVGFSDEHIKYKSYAEAEAKSKGILKPLYNNPFDAVFRYGNSSVARHRGTGLFKALSMSNPKEVAARGTGAKDAEGIPFRQAAGANLPFDVSRKLDDKLTNFKSTRIKNPVLRGAAKVAETVASGSRAVTFIGTPFHYAHVAEQALSAESITGHGVLGGRSLKDALAASLKPGEYAKIESRARIQDGGQSGSLMQYAKENGMSLPDTTVRLRKTVDDNLRQRTGVAISRFSPSGMQQRNMAQFINAFGLRLAEFARDKGIVSGSPEAIGLFKSYNRILGRVNDEVLGTNPTFNKVLSGGALAPHYVRSVLGQIPVSVSSFKGSKGIDLTSEGGAARASVVGQRLAGAAVAVVGSAIASGQMPGFKALISQAGFNPNNPNPNIQGGAKNQKGEKQTYTLSTDPIGLATGLATDPKHFTQSREVPVLSAISKGVTNTDWNGNPLVDKTQPGWENQMAKKLLGGLLPIGVQNFTSQGRSDTNKLTVGQGILQSFGLRLKTNPNDPQVVSQANYFNAKGQATQDLKQGNYGALDPSLQGRDPKFGQSDLNQWLSIHPASTVDILGNHVATPWNALAYQDKPGAYLANDQKTGAQILSPAYYIDKKLTGLDPSRPHSPLYDLQGQGITVDGSQAPKQLVAMQYQNMGAGDPQRAVLMQANPWLKDYESASAYFGNNYKQEMTTYMQGLGWSGTAIKQYFAKYQDTPAPAGYAPLKLTDQQQGLFDQLNNAQTTDDISNLFKAHPELSDLIQQEAVNTNNRRKAAGNLELQNSPQESDHVKAVLDSMPQGADTASKTARGQLIKANPDVAQYLADSTLRSVTKNLSQFNFQNPLNPGASEGQLLNSGTRQAQSTLAGISNLGTYDIGKDPLTGISSFIQGGSLPSGDTTGSGSSKKPFVPNPRIKKVRKVFIKRTQRGKKFRAPKMRKQNPIQIRTSSLRSAKVAQPSRVVKVRA
jgi:2-oxo-4-hydroxy-4-carboxy--5-ureidoimidazoline (OHCU) decarboxylase